MSKPHITLHYITHRLTADGKGFETVRNAAPVVHVSFAPRPTYAEHRERQERRNAIAAEQRRVAALSPFERAVRDAMARAEYVAKKKAEWDNRDKALLEAMRAPPTWRQRRLLR